MRSVRPGSSRMVLGALAAAAVVLALAIRPEPSTIAPSGTSEPVVSSGAADGSCSRRLPVTRSGGDVSVAYCANRELSLGIVDPTVRSAVIVVHGDARNASDYFAYVAAAARSAGRKDVLIVAPRFATNGDVRRDALGADVLTWASEAWKEGGDSMTTDEHPSSVSSFEVMDELVAILADSARFPNLASLVIAGHSAGGQYVNRYAAGSSAEDVARDGIAFTYVVANPSSYLYFDDRRVVGRDGAIDRPSARDRSDCRSYDRYKYGLHDRNRYMAERGEQAIVDQYRSRRVVYALGTLDTDEHADSMDTSCAGRLQGRNRLERGLNYDAYLATYYGPEIRQVQTLITVPDVGHDGQAMLAASALQPILFGPP